MSIRPSIAWLLCLATLASWVQAENDKHLGVASCASSVCHGRVEASKNHGATMTEYSIWFRLDRHAQAFATLKTDLSKRIAANLNIEDAAQAPVCLNCHADNVAQARRGEDFHLSDGVACENCHGAAEHWIADHYGDKANYKKSVTLGMTDLADPVVRAKVCLDCHMGDKNQLTTHRIMAAGHPRLRFELSTYESVMPAHHQVDEDYRQRKPAADIFQQWAAGIVAGNVRYLELVLGDAQRMRGPFPEFALFDCFSCHQAIPRSEKAGFPKSRGEGLGMPTFNTANFYLLDQLIANSSKELLPKYRAALKVFLRSHSLQDGDYQRAGNQLLTVIRSVQDNGLTQLQADPSVVLKRLMETGVARQFSDYSSAEQLFMSFDVLQRVIDNPSLPAASLDSLYRTFTGAERFSESVFFEEIKRLGAELKLLEPAP